MAFSWRAGWKPPSPDVSMTESRAPGLPDLAAAVEGSWRVTGLWGHLGLQVPRRIKMKVGGRGWNGEDYELTSRKGSGPCLARSQLSLVFTIILLLCHFPMPTSSTTLIVRKFKP